ncbi:D-alanyl-D-alanine carboxypeptidase/D-alanyl-D-alanine-endopeptidase, partial [bacterium]
SFDPADGSGLSRKNLVTARSVVRLLNWSRRQTWGATFLTALADPSTGTLKGRLGGLEFRGKTGTLDGACSLSGFVRCRSGRELAVSLLVNHYACSTARVRALQDEFVKRVAAGY